MKALHEHYQGRLWGVVTTPISDSDRAAGQDAIVPGTDGEPTDHGVSEGDHVWQKLESPRPLSPGERDLLVSLVAAIGHQAATEQLRTVMVQGSCRCGCPSVLLAVTGPVIPAPDILRLAGRRDDYLAVWATAGTKRSGLVDVNLHVVNGLVHELEVFAGVGVTVPLPSSETLRGVKLVNEG